MEANLLAADVPIRLAKIRLRMTWTMAQRHEHLPRPQHLRRSILTHDRVAAAKARLHRVGQRFAGAREDRERRLVSVSKETDT
jgi:hypothetical protein